jgi:voltage-gated potassium channel Kch
MKLGGGRGGLGGTVVGVGLGGPGGTVVLAGTMGGFTVLVVVPVGVFAGSLGSALGITVS